MLFSPSSLYDVCLNVTVEDCIKGYRVCEKELKFLPNNILFDFYYRLYLENHLCLLGRELGDLEIFHRLLSVKSKRTEFLQCFQSLIDHGNRSTKISEILITQYSKYLKRSEIDINFIDIGLRLGGFLNEGGWYLNCIKILNITEELCEKHPRNEMILKKLLDCYHKKIYAEVSYKEFEAAERTYKLAKKVVSELEDLNSFPNLAAIYSNFSALFYMKSEYDEALKWSKKALRLLSNDLPVRVVIEVLRQASKSCIVKRWFNQAGFLIRQALSLASDLYATDHHPHYADTLSDYGFYLLNYDSTEDSVKVYEKSLSIRKTIFIKNNINVALAHEDLAYVLYVHEYSSGSFNAASENAEKALKIMRKILPPDHLLIASAKRVKALILEEIALDLRVENSQQQNAFLLESEELHKEALASSFKTFGENNVFTAKQYGNLGRLYQSMKKFEEAESMHLKAIAIKEELLGESDYEVALSVGHLASLYNYQMSRYLDAEKLYKRSIEINVNLFGEAYSGLEYDYRGITHVYVKLGDTDNVLLYKQKMREWRRLREQIKTEVKNEEVLPLNEIIQTFFSMC
ncbi:hypothetical protein WA026_000384 [Henosepilachna vigintioctopunctata]|uniref:Amyloid protein-binding protein 2 n=1 Tax=Henosepilachna vigintioctopunctata TaxID=420089 RepID=A0AAW1UYB0_9CUCU